MAMKVMERRTSEPNENPSCLRFADLRKRYPLDTTLSENDAEGKDDDSDTDTYNSLDEFEDFVSGGNTSRFEFLAIKRRRMSHRVDASIPGSVDNACNYTNETPATGSRESVRDARSTRFLDPSRPHGKSYPGDPSESGEDPRSSLRHMPMRFITSSTAHLVNAYYPPRPSASAPPFPSGGPPYIGSSNPFTELPPLPPPYRRGYLPPPPSFR
jgi:hypothetical protein